MADTRAGMPQRVKKSYRATLEPPLTVVRTSVFAPPKISVRWLHIALACAGLVAAVLRIYARTAHFGFIDLDDPAAVLENPAIKDGLSGAFTATRPLHWQPLAYLSHMLDCQLFGL